MHKVASIFFSLLILATLLVWGAWPAMAATWVEVDLSEQTLRLHKNGQVVLRTRVSTGIPRHKTPTGRFQVWTKIPKAKMSGGSKARGDYYYLPNVPYIMYFYQGFGLHGTYWHKNFGRPMSHGCVNLSIPDAKYLYQHVRVGTPVVIRL